MAIESVRRTCDGGGVSWYEVRRANGDVLSMSLPLGWTFGDRLDGPFVDESGLVWPKGKPVISMSPKWAQVISSEEMSCG